jgi:epoxyqueuosine reductase
MDRLREMLLARGAALVGFADLGELYPEVRYHLPRGLSIAVALNPHIVANIAAGPTREYGDEYDRVNQHLNDLAAFAAGYLADLRYRVKAIESTVAYVDPSTCSAPFQHKTVATRAGLGWIGKDALLITRQFGSAVRLVSVLTDAPLPVGRPIDHSLCGDCRACVDACPGKAIKGVDWQVGMFRDELYDAFVCRETALKLAGLVGVPRTVCGICINACPYTRKYIVRAMAGEVSLEEGPCL